MDNIPIKKRKLFQLKKGKHSNYKEKNIQIRKRKIFGNGKYFLSELVNIEMAEEERTTTKRLKQT